MNRSKTVHRVVVLRFGGRLLVAVWLLACCGMPAALGTTPDVGSNLPEARQVVDRILERAARVAQDTDGCAYTYEQRARVEELDGTDQVTKTTEKTYRVSLIQGFPFSRLIRIEGRKLSAEELRKEDQREQEFLRRISARDFESMARQKETWITRELTDHYAFTVQSREVQEDRPMLVLDFTPQPGQRRERGVQDRILGRLAGRMWVDEADSEVATIEVRLIGDFSLGWLGILGSVQQCDIRLERRRLPEGCWVNLRHSVFLVGRKLLSPMRFRSVAESSAFRKG